MFTLIAVKQGLFIDGGERLFFRWKSLFPKEFHLIGNAVFIEKEIDRPVMNNIKKDSQAEI